MAKTLKTRLVAIDEQPKFNKTCKKFRDVKTLFDTTSMEKRELTELLKLYAEDTTESIYIASEKYRICVSLKADSIDEVIDKKLLASENDAKVTLALQVLRDNGILKTKVSKGGLTLRSVEEV